MMKENKVIQLEQLTKQYQKTMALDHVDLSLAPNKIYGLLGRNGAGKTTMLNLLSARIFPTEGKAFVFGQQAYENVPVLQQICFIEEKGFYDPMIRMRDFLKLAAGLYPNWDAAYAEALLQKFNLDAKKRFKQLSRGMETSLGLIIGLASRAPLTIFDEPSLGLDAVVREQFYDEIIEDFSRHPRTFIISTHLIDEISRIFEDVIIIDQGRVLLQEDMEQLKTRMYYLSGPADLVRSAVPAGAIPLHEEQFGSNRILALCSKQVPKIPAGVEQSSIPMQKLFVYLTDPNTQETLRKGGIIA